MYFCRILMNDFQRELCRSQPPKQWVGTFQVVTDRLDELKTGQLQRAISDDNNFAAKRKNLGYNKWTEADAFAFWNVAKVAQSHFPFLLTTFSLFRSKYRLCCSRSHSQTSSHTSAVGRREIPAMEIASGPRRSFAWIRNMALSYSERKSLNRLGEI